MITEIHFGDRVGDLLPSSEYCELFITHAVMSYFEGNSEGIILTAKGARKLARGMAARALENDE